MPKLERPDNQSKKLSKYGNIMLPRHRRFIGLVTIVIGVALASFFILNSFQKNPKNILIISPLPTEISSILNIQKLNDG